MELYCLCDEQLDLAGWLAHWHQLPLERIQSSLYTHHQDDALRHMMRVASGLDSQVLGEPQILGQMHAAYDEARAAGNMERSEEHTSALQSLMRISYDDFCLKKKQQNIQYNNK